MLKAFRKLWNDKRGNALIIAGAALPLLIGSIGLATDTVQWALWKRQLQRAADSAAYAGVYAKAQEGSPNTAVTQDLANNNHLWVSLLGAPVVTEPAPYGTFTNLVTVDLAAQQSLSFSSMFMAAAPIIRTSATAAMLPAEEYCVVALADTGPALIIGGNAHVDMGCGAISNSTDPTSSVSTNGTAYSFIADPVAAAGGMPLSINGATDLRPGNIALPDPLADKYSTEIPNPGACKNFQQQINGNPNGVNGVVQLQPGCYNSFTPGNNTYHLNPGVYYLNNTHLSLSGQTKLTGTGVTIILTGTNPGSLSMSGNSAMDLTAPTSATCGTFGGVNTCDYTNMLLIQSSNAAVGNNNTINGDNNTALDGAIYFPRGDMTFTGSSANATQCAMVVSYTVQFTGSANLQNDIDEDDCDANDTVTGITIRMIA